MIWLLACTRPDPELVATAQALQAYRRGHALLDTAPEEALDAFRDAAAARPDEPVLRGWIAAAQARSGDLETAIATLDAVLAQHPHFAEAHYNRAAWLARLGRFDDAERALATALRLGASSPREAVTDPDFMPHIADGRFPFLPRETLRVVVDAPSSVFLGGDLHLQLDVTGAEEHPVRVEAERARGPLRLLEVREDHRPDRRHIRYVFRVLGRGTATLGPFHVRAGPWEGTAPPHQVQILAPAEAPPAHPNPLSLLTPSAMRDASWGCAPSCVSPPAAPVWRHDAPPAVLGPPKLEMEPPPPEGSIRYRFGSAGLPSWEIVLYARATEPAPRARIPGGPWVSH